MRVSESYNHVDLSMFPHSVCQLSLYIYNSLVIVFMSPLPPPPPRLTASVLISPYHAAHIIPIRQPFPSCENFVFAFPGVGGWCHCSLDFSLVLAFPSSQHSQCSPDFLAF